MYVHLSEFQQVMIVGDGDIYFFHTTEHRCLNVEL